MRKLSWKDTALSSGATWDQVCHAVEYVVRWRLEHLELGTLRAIGVDEIHIGKSHKFLTLVYQIDAGCTRLLWVGQARTRHSFEKFLRSHRARAGRQDRVHLFRHVAPVPGGHCQTLPAGIEHPGPLPHGGQIGWCLLKRPENLMDKQNLSLRELLAYNLKSVRAYLLKG